MKHLFIVRHAKSTWDYPTISDIDRPLKDRGIKDAYEIANKVLIRAVLPDAIISSPAVRALHTAIIFARVINFPAEEIIINQDFYMADPSETLRIINETDDSRKSLMIFGHNPGFTELANYLSGMDIENIPTSGLVHLTFSTSKWKDISRKNLSGELFDVPTKE